MSLTDLYDSASPCIIGFISRMDEAPVDQRSPFPQIIGTGFLVTADGVVATNRHVVEALLEMPTAPDTGGPSGAAFVFRVADDNEGGEVLPLKILQVTRLLEFSPDKLWFGQDVPDVGFVQLEITGTPFLELATEDFSLRAGMEIATMGYPLGTVPLTHLGKVNQFGPLIRRGIVSSVYPFSCPHPHGFTIDIMQQGGSSGSPIFAGHSSRVVGMMWGGVQEPRHAQMGTCQFSTC